MPVPRILEYEFDPPELDRSIALTSRISGVPLSTSAGVRSVEDIGIAAGTALASINRTPVSGYGWVTGVTVDGMLKAEHSTRAAWAAEYIDAAGKVAASTTLSPHLIARLQALIDAWAAIPETVPASLAHGDFDSTHIYVDPETGEFTGIIDFGEIRGADPLYDLGHLLLHEGEVGRPGIFPHVLAGCSRVIPQSSEAPDHIQLQAIAIATRALAIQLSRPTSRYRAWLARRIPELISEMEEST